MVRACLIVSLAIAVSSAAARLIDAAAAQRPAAVSHAQVERNVLRALAGGWGRRRVPTLFNRRTHLLRDNTQAICRRVHGRRARLTCVVRPARHRRRQGLYVAYRALARGRYRLYWLFYRRGR